ncbi:hypothetical protein [Bacillus paranthracis]|uniref:hypothetical protein n=1 Tax=Bacillus paranthracis TaxID=2026186 RepID=UPI0022589B72|nr:hypothetical protein [Bacillus cereus]MCX3321558.1 hypothetical protein [Bacillus paranthracis]HDR4582818.1 hypothetical protein [Bacillus cereus]
MKTFSMWEFHEVQNMQAVQGFIREHNHLETAVNWQDTPLTSTVQPIHGFDWENPEVIEFGGREIRYIFFNCTTERARKEEYWYGLEDNFLPRAQRITPYQSEVLLFEYENSVKCIVFKGFNQARTILNDCLPTGVWGERSKANLPITEDLLYWIFRRYIDVRQNPLSNQHDMYVTALRSYAGKTKDNVNAMRGMGNRIPTILGTLAFLFNNENLKLVRPQLQYEGEVLLIELSLTGTFRIWEEEYEGRWLLQENRRVVNAISIYCFLVIIPTLVACYQENINRGLWSPELKLEFLQRLGNEIKDQVDAELERLQMEMVEDDGDLPEEEILEIFDLDEDMDE